MKTTQLIEEIRKSSIPVLASVQGDRIIFENTTIGRNFGDTFMVLPVYAEGLDEVRMLFYSMEGISLDTIQVLIIMLDVYLDTPLEDRKEERLYRFECILPALKDSPMRYLAHNKEHGHYSLISKEVELYQMATIFTSREKRELEAKGLLYGFLPEDVK